MSIFGERMRIVRGRRGISQAELARRLEMARQQINNYEQGRFEPSLEIAKRIADALDVSLDALTGRSELPESECNPAAVALVGA